MLSRAVLAVSALAVLVTPAVASATPTPTPASTGHPAAGVPTQGIIMSDGRICNPRWGC